MKSDRYYILHICDEIQFLDTALDGVSFSLFCDNPMLKHAVERSLEIIGEASKKLSPSFKEVYASIEWRAVAGTRDKLIHDYMGVDYELVWDILITKIPELKQVIRQALEEWPN